MLLAPIKAEDEDLAVRLECDPEMMLHIGGPRPEADVRAAYKRRFSLMEQGEARMYKIVAKNSAEVLGWYRPMDDYFAILTADEKRIFSVITEHALGLGYKAKQDKVKAIGYSFTHSRVKKQILRFTSSQGKPILRIKFFAAPAYSDFFHEAIRATIEEYDYKYTGCYGCGDCDGIQGYWYKYPDGRVYYRCGKELIEICDTRDLPLEELLDLLQRQHEFFLSSLPVK